MTYSETRYGYTHDRTNWFVSIIVALVLLAIGYLVFSADQKRRTPTPPAPLTSAHVLVDAKQGHGSATHIGNGIYVTAAHVVGKLSEVKINGVAAPVLWANEAYDIALLSGPETAETVPLSCVTATAGDVGIAHGNPMNLTDIATTLTVAGQAREIGDWKLALPMDGVVGPGMSGGGWVVGGLLAGVTVGASLAPAGVTITGPVPSYYGISIIVPGSAVCELMGRK